MIFPSPPPFTSFKAEPKRIYRYNHETESVLVQNILNVKYFYHYYSRCAACVGIFNRRYRIILHILSHFTCNRKNRKVFVFKRRSHRDASYMRQNLNNVANRLWRMSEKFTGRLTNVTLLIFILTNVNVSTLRYSSKDISLGS